jgi:hypothetical protein
MRGISLLDGNLLASQEGHCSMELVLTLALQLYLANCLIKTKHYRNMWFRGLNLFPSSAENLELIPLDKATNADGGQFQLLTFTHFCFRSRRRDSLHSVALLELCSVF